MKDTNTSHVTDTHTTHISHTNTSPTNTHITHTTDTHTRGKKEVGRDRDKVGNKNIIFKKEI